MQIAPQPRTSEKDKALPQVSIVIPCLNEGVTIAHCVSQARNWLESSGITGEVIVVDNNSTDDTAERAAEAGARVIHETSRGKGHAVRSGVAAAHGPIIVMSDGDGTYDLSELRELIEPLRDGYDMVIGDRLKGELAEGAMPWHHRYFGNPFFNAMITIATRRRFGDCLSGLRSFTRSAWAAMSPRAPGFQLESEMCLQAAKHGLQVKTVPISYSPRVDPSKLHSVKHGLIIAGFIMRRSPAAMMVPLVALLAAAGALGAVARRFAR